MERNTARQDADVSYIRCDFIKPMMTTKHAYAVPDFTRTVNAVSLYATDEQTFLIDYSTPLSACYAERDLVCADTALHAKPGWNSLVATTCPMPQINL